MTPKLKPSTLQPYPISAKVKLEVWHEMLKVVQEQQARGLQTFDATKIAAYVTQLEQQAKEE